MPNITYPLFTVIVFKGAPSSTHLTESYRRSFERREDATRYARTVTTYSRMNAATCTLYTPPCASVFEDSPSRGLGAHVAEFSSAARKRWLKRVASGEVQITSSAVAS